MKFVVNSNLSITDLTDNPTHNNAAESKTRRGIYGSPKKTRNIQIEHPNVAVKKREAEFD